MSKHIYIILIATKIIIIITILITTKIIIIMILIMDKRRNRYKGYFN